jgi:hypothetical protein
MRPAGAERCTIASYGMIDMLGAVKRLAARGQMAVSDAQLGFDFFAPAPAAPPASAPTTLPASPLAGPADAPLSRAAGSATRSTSGTASQGAAGAPRATVAETDAQRARPSRGAAARRAQAAMLLHRLHTLGLHSVDSITLMHTRRVMVSLLGRTLRIHEGYATAPEPVLRAVVTFATARTRAARLAARDVILAHPVDRPAAQRREEPARPGDAPLLARLADAHADLNREHFGGSLSRIPVRLSGRMKTRLGHYSPSGEDGPGAEIVLSRRHLRRDGWAEAMHTLLHEMVHQWQDETARPLDHGPAFRRKAKEVGVLPRARRAIGG